MTNYTIQSGDNLTKIAKAHNTTVQELARINNISDPNKIQAGKVIKLFETAIQPEQEVKNVETNGLTQQLESLQNQLSQMQNYMATEQEANNDGWDMLGFGLGIYGGYKIGEKVLPQAWNATKTAANITSKAGKNAGKVVKNIVTNTSEATASAAQNYASKIAAQAKHVAKKVELEYAFGKDAVKQGVKTTLSKSNKIMALTKAGKAVSKRLPGVGIAVAAVETYEAGKEGGTKAAVKQGVKSASGLACGAAGAKIGAIAGACTGPAAVVAVPVLTVVGGIAGYIGGEKLVDEITSWFE